MSWAWPGARRKAQTRETLVNVARSPYRSRRKPSGDRVAGLLAVRLGVLIRRVEPQVVPALPRIPGGTAYSDASRYGRATPSRVAEPFAVLIARHERLFMHPGRPVITRGLERFSGG